MKEISKYLNKNQDFQNKKHRCIQKAKLTLVRNINMMIKRRKHTSLPHLQKGPESSDTKE